MKAYNDLPANQLKRIISKYRWLYQLGLQGPDMFSYNIPILRHRDYRNVGSHMHESHVSEFFANYMEEMAHIPSKQQGEQALSYSRGYLNHYIGDSTYHPFVYGRIQYDTDNSGSQHHGLHAALENDIDALLLLKYKRKKPSQFNQAATVCLSGMKMQFVSRIMSTRINKTYYPITYKDNFQVTPAMVHRSIMAMRFGCRTLSDPSGIKRSSTGFVEPMFMRNPMASRKLATDTVKNPGQRLNLDHETRCNSWDMCLAFDQSFPELFRQYLSKCNTVYYLINQIIINGIPPEEVDFGPLLSELGSYSYHSGLAVQRAGRHMPAHRKKDYEIRY